MHRLGAIGLHHVASLLNHCVIEKSQPRPKHLTTNGYRQRTATRSVLECGTTKEVPLSSERTGHELTGALWAIAPLSICLPASSTNCRSPCSKACWRTPAQKRKNRCPRRPRCEVLSVFAHWCLIFDHLLVFAKVALIPNLFVGYKAAWTTRMIQYDSPAFLPPFPFEEHQFV